LIPNTNYHIKLVIADRGDYKSDSAIFLGANSFNVGQDVLGPDLTVANNTAMCQNDTHLLTSGLNPTIYSFAWTLNGNTIGGNTANLPITQAGMYGLTYTIIATNCPVTTDFINVESYTPVQTPNPVDLIKCSSSSATTIFDLSYNTPIVSTATTQISYHNSRVEALSNMNPIATRYVIVSNSLPVSVWVRIYNNSTRCTIAKSFQLRLTPPPVANIPANTTLCESASGSKTANFDISTLTNEILGAQLPSIYDVSYYIDLNDANAGTNRIAPSSYTSGNTTLFARIQNTTDPSCFSTTSFNLIVLPRPTLDTTADQFVCTSYTLPPLINPGKYYSGSNKGLPLLNAGDVITKDQTIYVYHETTGTPSCPNEWKFEVKIITTSDINAADVTTCDQFQLPNVIFGMRYYTLPGGPNGGGTEIPVGKSVTTPGTSTFYTYFTSTDLANPCVLEGKFNITLYATPVIAPIANVFDCISYNLPPLTVGNYYTFDSLTGIYTPAISPITTTTKLYVFATNNICRTADIIFTVYINTLGIQNRNECRSYELPTAPVGEYRDAPNGGGNIIPAGNISQTTTIYSYVPTAGTPNCTDDDFFTITINAPKLSTPVNVTACASFTLPVQTDNGEYYTL
jgi:hypothetical protein